jgi:hypothetical protein
VTPVCLESGVGIPALVLFLDLATGHRSWQLPSEFKTQTLGTSSRLAILRNVEVLLGALRNNGRPSYRRYGCRFKVKATSIRPEVMLQVRILSERWPSAWRKFHHIGNKKRASITALADSNRVLGSQGPRRLPITNRSKPSSHRFGVADKPDRFSFVPQSTGASSADT